MAEKSRNLADNEHQSMLRAYFTRQIGAGADVEDYVQDVFVRVLSAAPSERVGNWRGFLLRVASTLLIDRFRRDRARQRDQHHELEEAGELVDEKAVSPEQVLIGRQNLERLEDALRQVDPIARNVFLLVRVDGLRHRDVAERLGMDTRTVTRLVDRVLVHLSRHLAETEQ
jgi:RNA polymerase sigma-70 factor (ECF subfamily)